MTKIKLSQKTDLARPELVDEIRLVSLEVNWRDEILVVNVALIDTDTDPPTIVSERPIHIGFRSPGEIDLDELKKQILSTVNNSGVLPGLGELVD